LDIISVVQQYVPSLKHTGRNYFGLCPFHKEKSASFSVNPELGLFKCFGCGEGGDVIKFIEKIEGLDFPQALEIAAKRAGVTLVKSYNPENAKFTAERTRLLEANELSTKFYEYSLFEHASGKPGLAYAKKRRLAKKEMQKFRIGYAPKSFSNLKNFLNKKGFLDKDLIRWGLLAEKNGKTYDKFRDRLMFPIISQQGDVVGFSGRLINSEDLGPKYLNSPETIVYKKSNLLFGLYQAKEAIRKENIVIIVEGNIDLLTSHSVGVENIVAPLGTALTETQLKLLKRYCDTVYFALDTDAAGEKALIRSLEIAAKVGLKSYILDLNPYKDVDELIIKGGDWKKTLAHPNEAVPYFLEKWQSRYDLSKTFGKTEYSKKILDLIAASEDRIAQADYLHKLASKIGLEVDVLNKELDKTIGRRQKQQISYRKEPSEQEKETEPEQPDKLSKLASLKMYLLALALAHKREIAKVTEFNLDEAFSDFPYGQVWQAIKQNLSLKEIRTRLVPNEQEIFDTVSLMNTGEFSSDAELKREIEQAYKNIRSEELKIKIRELKQKSRQNDNDVSEELNKLTKEFTLISRQQTKRSI
jgi:DNA primase